MLHVSDAVNANIFAMQFDGRFNGAHFDTATGTNISLNEIKEIVKEYHPEVTFDYVEERRGDVRVTKAYAEPLKKLGWSVIIDINSGIHSCFNQSL